MKIVWACLLGCVTGLASAQTAPPAADAVKPYQSITEFGLTYPLSNDWIRATSLARKGVESPDTPRKSDILLAAVYVPKSDISAGSPFFILRAFRQQAGSCKKSMEAMIAKSEDEKYKREAAITEFSAAGRDYYRVNLPQGKAAQRQVMICTAANNHLLIWNAAASNDKGFDQIVATLNSIAPLPPPDRPEPPPTVEQKEIEAQDTAKIARPEKVRVSRGVASGMLINKVNPIYPDDARHLFIQGTVVLQAVISKTGDIVDLELLEGPIELAGSAVAAVRQWKYKPYLLMGQPVAVDTQIQVNYELRR